MKWYIEIENFELELELGIYYQPLEKETRWYPGCHEEITIDTIHVFGQEIPLGHPISNMIADDYDNIFEDYVEGLH